MNASCMCQAVKFTINGEPENTFCCYCRHCQLNASAPGQWSIKINKENIGVISGDKFMSTWTLKDTQSGSEKHKVFCKQCGCTLWTIPMKHNGEYLIVRTGLIEDGFNLFSPRTELFKR